MQTTNTQSSTSKQFLITKLPNLLISSLSYCLLIGFLLLVIPPVAVAETMQSSSFRIRLGNFNMTGGSKGSSSYSLTDTVGQTAAGLFSSSGYAVLAGFQYIYTLYPFSFSISDLSIDFGSLTPNSFSSGSNTLTVSAPGQGYTVTTYEINRLNSGSNYIADTQCDVSCNESTAGVWTSTSALGFGYNMNGNDVPATFIGSTYFRPFPDFSQSESPAAVMTSSAAGRNRTATVTYRVNIGGSQAAGNYVTQIVFIATPVY